VSLFDPVVIGEGTIVHDCVAIRGPGTIGNDCEIGPNAYIGPYTSVGNNVTIRNSEIENSICVTYGTGEAVSKPDSVVATFTVT
jgi:NDP-sugar pyrophosphorylase family protein